MVMQIKLVVVVVAVVVVVVVFVLVPVLVLVINETLISPHYRIFCINLNRNKLLTLEILCFCLFSVEAAVLARTFLQGVFQIHLLAFVLCD